MGLSTTAERVDAMFDGIDFVDAKAEVLTNFDGLASGYRMIGDVKREVRIKRNVEFHDRSHGDGEDGLDRHLSPGENDAARHGQPKDSVQFGISCLTRMGRRAGNGRLRGH